MCLLNLLFSGIYVLLLFISKVTSKCILPSELNGKWWDSGKGVLTFVQNTTKLSGWSFMVYSQTLSDFTCVEGDRSLFLFKTDNYVHSFGVAYSGFLCMQYTKITSHSYRYYLISDEEQEEKTKSRVKLIDVNTVTQPYSISGICNPRNGPGVEEYHVLVMQVSGKLNCVTYVSDGSNYFATVINSDGQDRVFTCLAAVSSVDKVLVSTNPGSCAKGQTPSLRTSNPSSVTLSLIPYVNCPYNITSYARSDTNVGAVVGGILGTLLFVFGILTGYFLYRRYCKRRLHIRHHHKESVKSVPTPHLSYSAGLQHCYKVKSETIPDFIVDTKKSRKSEKHDNDIEEIILHTPRV